MYLKTAIACCYWAGILAKISVMPVKLRKRRYTDNRPAIIKPINAHVSHVFFDNSIKIFPLIFICHAHLEIISTGKMFRNEQKTIYEIVGIFLHFIKYFYTIHLNVLYYRAKCGQKKIQKKMPISCVFALCVYDFTFKYQKIILDDAQCITLYR